MDYLYLTKMKRRSNYLVFSCKNYIDFNSQSQDIYNIHLKNDRDFTIETNLTVEYVLDFIKSHKNDPEMYLIFYAQKRQGYELPILQFLSKTDPATFKMKVIFFTFDFWRRCDEPYNAVMKRIFHAKNHYVFTFAKDIEQLTKLSYYSQEILKINKNRIIFDTNLWCSYNSAFIEFNIDPQPLVCLSGSISLVNYPERHLMRTLSKTEPKIVILPCKIDGQYTRKLNRYLCCFASSVRILGTNTHLILLKVFEILASGSLLLCPDTEEKYLNEIGLYHMKTCFLCDMKDISKVVEKITLESNRDEIDKIRKNGYLFAKTNFTSEMKYKQIKRQIMSI